MTKLINFKLSSASCQVTWARFHRKYIFISSFSYWKARRFASNCGCIIWTIYQSSVVFRKELFQN